MSQGSRYQKQELFHGIGRTGQERLRKRSVLLVGCGALGCTLADAMVRAGVGELRIADRDFVELSNLQRQMLFTEDDVTSHLPKAIAATERLQRVNSDVSIVPTVTDVSDSSILDLASGADILLDGTDNFETRYLVNDASLELGIPWIFTGCTGSHGQMMPVFPHRSACLRCLMPAPPPPGSTETCDTAGVLGPAIGVIASFQAATALKILVADDWNSPNESDGEKSIAGVPLNLTMIDVWEQTIRQMDVSGLRAQTECPACGNGERLWLNGRQTSGSTILCGRNAVQISPPEKLTLSLPDLAARLESAGHVTSNPFLVRVRISDSALEMTVFPDGRAIVKGTEDPAVSRSIYARYIGS